MKKYKVGVFDSGVGGLSVANAIKKAIPDIEIILVEDKKNVPYGTKSIKTLKELVFPLLQDLDDKVDLIVVACNTVSTILGEELKQEIIVPIVTVVPMIKPATEITKTKVIAVCATPTTLASPRYQQLKIEYAKNVEVIEPDCSDWSGLIEKDELAKLGIDKMVSDILRKNADVIVLGCTHYHWIEDEIVSSAGPAVVVLQPEQAIISQVRRVLGQLA